jgi:hypothetical protein
VRYLQKVWTTFNTLMVLSLIISVSSTDILGDTVDFIPEEDLTKMESLTTI